MVNPESSANPCLPSLVVADEVKLDIHSLEHHVHRETLQED
jgi:hypothetical protein